MGAEIAKLFEECRFVTKASAQVTSYEKIHAYLKELGPENYVELIKNRDIYEFIAALGNGVPNTYEEAEIWISELDEDEALWVSDVIQKRLGA